MKKFLGIICIVLIVGSYFLYDYRSKAILESKQGVKPEETVDYSDSPLNEELRAMVYDFWKYTGKDTIQAGKSDMQVLGQEKKLPPKITTLIFYKNDGHSYLSLAEAYYFYKDKAVSYTYFDDNLIVYYGNDGVTQNLLDTTKMSTDFDFLTKYNAEGKPEIKASFMEKSYELK